MCPSVFGKEGDINFYRLLNFLFVPCGPSTPDILSVIFHPRDSILFLPLFLLTMFYLIFFLSFFLPFHCHDYSAIAVAYSLWDRYRPSIEFDVEIFFSSFAGFFCAVFPRKKKRKHRRNRRKKNCFYYLIKFVG